MSGGRHLDLWFVSTGFRQKQLIQGNNRGWKFSSRQRSFPNSEKFRGCSHEAPDSPVLKDVYKDRAKCIDAKCWLDVLEEIQLLNSSVDPIDLKFLWSTRQGVSVIIVASPWTNSVQYIVYFHLQPQEKDENYVILIVRQASGKLQNKLRTCSLLKRLWTPGRMSKKNPHLRASSLNLRWAYFLWRVLKHSLLS